MRIKERLKILIWAILLSLPIDYMIAGVLYAYNDQQPWYTQNVFMTVGVTTIILLSILYIFKYKGISINNVIGFHYTGIAERKQFFIEFYNLNSKDIIILVISLLTGFVLRIAGYNWGLVASWQPDECKLVNQVIRMARDRILYSESVYYPNQFVSKFAAIITFIYARITDTPVQTGTMVEAYFIFRILVVMLGTATVLSSFLIGNHIKKHLGSVFSLLVAIYPYYISLSKQVTGDATALFFLSVTLLFSLRYYDDRRYIYIILMAMGAAMATLEKWHGAVGIGYIGIVLLISYRGWIDFVKRGVCAVISWYLWMFMFAPNIMIKPKKAIVDGFVNIAVYDGTEGTPFYIHLWKYFCYGFENIGGITYILIVIIGVVIVFRHISADYSVLLLGIIKVIILSFLNRGFSRWALELYYSEILLTSISFLILMEAFVRQARVLIWIVGVVVFLDYFSNSMLAASVAYNNDNDSRLVQRKMCVDMNITPSNMISQYYSGFGAASWCDSEYPDTAKIIKDWSEYFIEESGVLFRTSLDYDYVCLNITRSDVDRMIAERLDEDCYRVLEFHPIIRDSFDIPFEHTERTLNDLKKIEMSFDAIKSIHSGALTGDEIIVYYVGNLGVMIV